MSYTFNGSGTLTGSYVTNNIGSATNITITGFTIIENYAFAGKNITTVTISNSVISISNGLFYNCPSLQIVNIPNSVTSIGFDAFLDCPSLFWRFEPDFVCCSNSKHWQPPLFWLSNLLP